MQDSWILHGEMLITGPGCRQHASDWFSQQSSNEADSATSRGPMERAVSRRRPLHAPAGSRIQDASRVLLSRLLKAFRDDVTPRLIPIFGPYIGGCGG
jgi:hypothetical protein